jgi:aminoglycoside 3-N-acetyltransferase
MENRNNNRALPMYKYGDDQYLYYKDIVRAIKSLEINDNDLLFIQSGFIGLGRPADLPKNDLLGLWVTILQECVPFGTIVMPTWNFDFAQTGFFDVQNAQAKGVGALPEFFRKQQGVRRTAHPMFSCAVWGADQDYLCDVSEAAFGKDSIFEKMLLRKAKNLKICLTDWYIIFEHYMEWKAQVSYRFHKEFSGLIKDGDKKYPYTCSHYCKHLDHNLIQYDQAKLVSHLDKLELIKRATLGESNILAIGLEPLYNFVIEQLEKDEMYLLKMPGI